MSNQELHAYLAAYTPPPAHDGCTCWGDEDCAGYVGRVTHEIWDTPTQVLAHVNAWHGHAFPICGDDLASIQQLAGRTRS